MEILQSYLTANPCYGYNLHPETAGKKESLYRTFQTRGPLGLMLHSVGTAQPDASVFVKNWNKSTYTRACVHAFIDANSGVIMQTLPWNYRGWHCGGSGNDTMCGVEMCESGYIKYTSGTSFTILNKEKAQEDCKRTYESAVELFAMICKQFALDPLKDICSHREGGIHGVASKHADPEHYWAGLGMPYTMDGFRADVKEKMYTDNGYKTPIRIQVGAFNNPDYARAYLKEVRKTFPNAFAVDADGKVVRL